MTVAINRYISDVEIEVAAMRLLQRYGKQRYPILAPPVPIEEIIEYTIAHGMRNEITASERRNRD